MSFIGKGKVYLGPYGAAGAMRPVGNCSKLTLSVDEETKKLLDYMTAGGGVASKMSRISGVTATMALREFNAENIALAVYGEADAVTGSSVTDETHTAYKGGLVRLAHINPSTVVVTNEAGTTTYDITDDYLVYPGGIYIVPTGDIVDAQVIKVDYAYPAQNVIEAIVNSAQEWVMAFDGLNEAKTGNPVVVDVYRVKFGPTKALDMIEDDFGTLELTGESLKDETKTGPGIRQYFKWTFIE
jgi:hypothetical protein